MRFEEFKVKTANVTDAVAVQPHAMQLGYHNDSGLPVVIDHEDIKTVYLSPRGEMYLIEENAGDTPADTFLALNETAVKIGSYRNIIIFPACRRDYEAACKHISYLGYVAVDDLPEFGRTILATSTGDFAAADYEDERLKGHGVFYPTLQELEALRPEDIFTPCVGEGEES